MRILVGKKIIKEPKSGGMGEEEKPAGRERREEKKNCCPSSCFLQFKNAVSNKVAFLSALHCDICFSQHRVCLLPTIAL